jgi:hypothetical protein
LQRLLLRSLRTAVLRRAITWMACALLFVLLGSALSSLSGNARVFRLGLLMATLSALPAFLLWPIGEKRLWDRLRTLDQETVFEAFLEAEPGAARDILRHLAAERASALGFVQPPRERVLAGLGRLCAAALVCLLLVEGGSFLFLGRPVPLALAEPTAERGGRRLDATRFADFPREDPAASRVHRERIPQEARGENPALGDRAEASGRGLAPGRTPSGEAGPVGAQGNPLGEALAKRRQGDRDAGDSPASAPQGTPGRGEQKPPEPGAGQASGSASVDSASVREPAPFPLPGRMSQGYEHTPDTQVPSPLLDYRTRFEARYAEMTGGHLAVVGRLGLGDLRRFQRRYWEAFSLKAEVGAADDPYVAQLKRRWAELRGGAW